MSRLIGSLVMRNEEARYLKPVLLHHLQFCDEICVFDDRSTDNSVEIAISLGCNTAVRDEETPSFLEHEGRFRQAAWEFLGAYAQEGDWVLSFDADEFLVGVDVSGSLQEAISQAKFVGLPGISLEIPEVFSLSANGVPLIRMDGYWKAIKGVRLFQYENEGRFLDRPMGCGSAPLYVESTGISKQSYGLSMLHYGYVEYEDRLTKYQRYKSLVNSGHNQRHIESILTEPSLVMWQGPYPQLGVERV